MQRKKPSSTESMFMSALEEAKNETLMLLEKAGAFIKESEYLFDNNFPVPALNEFRNVAYHLAAYIKDTANEEALYSSLRHAQKAYLDAAEAYAVALLEEVEACEKDFNGYSEIVMEILPNYHKQVRTIQTLHQKLISSPGASSEERLNRAREMESLFPTINAYLKDLRVFKLPIQDKIRKSKNVTKQWLIGILISIVSAALSILIPLLLG